ncbi:MAG TPA: radical SAM protein [Methanocorpusculum sp.]|nr:radical SAM protein [Methanocorpusculum sp.]
MTSDAIILDGYVDEPACLGVPPYISPYIRTCAGVLKEHGFDADYVTVDELRKNPLLVTQLRDYKYVVMIAGVTVPGKYLSGTPATISELQQIGFQLKGKTTSFLGGPISFGYSPEGGAKAVKNDVPGWSFMLPGEPAAALDSYLCGGEPQGILSYSDFDRWVVFGADIIKKHPMFPHVMLELETARGCNRCVTGGCSFCTEPFYGMPRQRGISGISAEVKALSAAGAVHFRLGRQPDLISYGVSGGEFPKPDGDVLRKLFSEIRSAALGLKTLHIDNVNPGTIAHHPDAARDALCAIIDGHTAGDIAAFGVESADPAVIAANNLKGSPDEIFSAVEIVNEVGAARRDGIPELLPGLNFISGLAGESPETFEINKAFLKRIFDAGLLVRRVNIRQLMPFEGTRAYENNMLGLHDKLFQSFKESVRSSFDVPMLERVFPVGTVLKDVQIEVSGAVSFGRQMGTYPILVGIPENIAVGMILDCAVVSYGARSVTALRMPIRFNEMSHTMLKWVPGISKKVLPKVIAKMPFADEKALKKVIDSDLVNPLLPLMKF